MLLLPPPLKLLDLEWGILCNQIWKMLPFLIEIYATQVYSQLQIHQESTDSLTSIQPTRGAQTEYTRHRESNENLSNIYATEL